MTAHDIVLHGATGFVGPTAVRRSGILQAQARVAGPPPDTPSTAKRFSPNASANSDTSSGQSSSRRPGWKSERPKPGRSGAMSRKCGRKGESGMSPQESLEDGFPWNSITGYPCGSPYSA